MIALLEKIFRKNKKDAKLDQPEGRDVKLEDYFHQMTADEVDRLYGKEITIKFPDGDLRGKIKASLEKDVDGYYFVFRQREDLIIRFGNIFPQDIEPLSPYDKSHAKFYKINNDEFFFDVGGGVTSRYIRENDNIWYEYDELDNYLRQETFYF